MKRRWHTLRANKGCETAQNIIVFDTETKPEKLPGGVERDHLWFGWLCAMSRTSLGEWGQERWHRFETVAEFWDLVESIVRPRTKWFLFCHNTNFDLPVLDVFNVPPRRGWILKASVIEGPPTIITWRKDTVTLTFLDTLNWWRMPLAKLGDRLGCRKLAFPGVSDSRAVWDAYCRQDVGVLVETLKAWFAFLITHDLGGFAPTLASQAFRSYRHRFMKHDIVVDADDDACNLAREAYHGGRVECFRLGRIEETVYGYDINSMYPAVMRGRMYPTKLLAIYPHQHRDRWRALTTRWCVVARCTVRARMPTYPLHTKGGLSFPLGEFETTLTTPEIRLAIQRRELLEMRDIAVYEAAPIFTAFVNFFWKMRRACQVAGDEVGAWLFKILANSLYGKFGQTGLVYETVANIEDLSASKFDIVDYDTGQVYRARQMAGLLQVMSTEGEARDSHPAIAAHVTAQARVLLWRLIQCAGLANTLYTDTDSLYVTREGADALQSWVAPGTLGKLKALGQWPWMTLHGLKDYELPGHKVTKGVRVDAVEVAPNTYRQVQWTSLKGLLREGDMTAPGRKPIIKHLARIYKKPRTI